MPKTTEELMPRFWTADRSSEECSPVPSPSPYTHKNGIKTESYTEKPVQLREQDKIDVTELINHDIRLGGRLYEMTAQHAERRGTC